MENTLTAVERLNTEEIARLEEHVDCQLSGRVHDFRVQLRDDGLVLCGRAPTYYAKQMAQHLVMRATDLPIRANDIQVA